MSEQAGHHRRMVEAVLFAASVPVDAASLAARLPEDADVEARLAELAQSYANRGVNLVRVAGGWAFRTAPDLAFLLRQQSEVPKRLSRAAVETLAIIAYHQPGCEHSRTKDDENPKQDFPGSGNFKKGFFCNLLH